MPRREVSVGSSLTPILVRSIAEALVPRAVREQTQRQMAMKALAEFQPTVSRLPQQEKEKFYEQFFPAFGVDQPPALRKLFGEKEKAVIPLPKGWAQSPRLGFVRPENKTPIVPGEEQSATPWNFPEDVDAEDLRGLIKEQRRAQLAATQALEEDRKAPKPYQPMTEEEYTKYHTPQPRPWAPQTEEEYAKYHTPQPRPWTPGSKEEYKEVHPPREPRQEPEEKISISEPVRHGMRKQLMGIILASKVRNQWLSDEELRKATVSTAGVNDPDVIFDAQYQALSPQNRQRFDLLTGMAEKHYSRLGSFGAVNQALHEWHSQQRGAIQPSTPPKVREKALKTPQSSIEQNPRFEIVEKEMD